MFVEVSVIDVVSAVSMRTVNIYNSMRMIKLHVSYSASPNVLIGANAIHNYLLLS